MRKLNENSSLDQWRQAKAEADNPSPGSRFSALVEKDPFGSFTLTPAYGRVYTSKRAVLADYNAGKDFISQPDGRYCNIEDIKRALATFVKIRYGKGLTKVMVV